MNELNCFKEIRFERLTLTDAGISTMAEAISKASEYDYAVLYSDSGVYIAVIENGRFITNTGVFPENITELRAFNKEGEIHAVLCGNIVKGRIVKDDFGDAAEVFDERHLLFGDRCEEAENGFYKYSEDRGTVLYLQFPKADGERAYVEVRNYTASSGDDLLFIDWRLLSFGKEEIL